MRKLLQVTMALAAVALAPSAGFAKDWTHIKIAMEGTYPPDNSLGPDGKLVGFSPDLAADLCRRMKITCDLIAQDWDSLIPSLNAGKFDVIMTGMTITPKREEVINFSEPFLQIQAGFGVQTGGPLAALPHDGEVVSLNDKAATERVVGDLKKVLAGKTVGVTVSTTEADFLNNYFKGDFDVRSYPTLEAQDTDLENGRVDATVAVVTEISGTADHSKGAVMLAGPRFTGGALGSGSGAGFRKSDQDLKAKFDAAIKEALADGTVKKLAVKWFKVDVTPR